MNGIHQGYESERNGTPRHIKSRSQARRIPSVEEALPYTPFTSIVPFDSGESGISHPTSSAKPSATAIIPVPEAIPTSLESDRPSYSASLDRIDDLHRGLDAEASNAGPTSSSFRQTRSHICNLLNQVEIPDFKFKAPSLHSISSTPSTHQTNGHAPHLSHSRELRPYAKMIYDSTDVPFRYPTPASPLRERQNDQCGPGLPEQPFPLLTPKRESRPTHKLLAYNAQTNGRSPAYTGSREPRSPPKAKNNAARHSLPPQKASHHANGLPFDDHQLRLQASKTAIPPSSAPQSSHLHQATAPGAQISTPTKQRIVASTPRSAPSKPASSFSIQVPQLPPSSRASQYVKLPEVDAKIISEQQGSKKRKREAEDEQSLGDDDREVEAAAAVDTLQKLLMEIFEAEDQLAPDTSGIVPQAAQRYFVFSSLQNGRQPALEVETLTRLDSALLKVLRVRRVSNLPVEQLVHVQQLCAASFGLSQGEQLNLPDDTSEESLDAWHRRLEFAVNGMRAAKPLLRTMIGAPSEKTLHSNDYVQELLDGVRHVFDELVVPLIEKRGIADDIEPFRLREDAFENVKMLLQQAGSVLKLLGNLVLDAELTETSINSLEFLATGLLFVENASKEKESVLGILKVENLRRTAMDTTAKIFLRHPDQRRPIFDEVLSSLEKLPVARQSARQYRIANAKSIQLVSALIMQLVQTSTTRSLQEKHERRSIEDSDGEDSSSDGGSEKPTSENRPPKRRSADQTTTEVTAVDGLSAATRPLVGAANSNATYVMHYLVKRAMTSTKTGDQPYRNLLDIFTEDFLNVLGNPAWPAAELLLRALLSSLFSILDNEKATAPAKNMALDLLGLIGATVSELRASVTRAAESQELLAGADLPDLQSLCEEALTAECVNDKLLDIRGLYRVVFEQSQRGVSNDLQLKSASSYHLASWAQGLLVRSEGQSPKLDEVRSWLLTALIHPEQVSNEHVLEPMTESAIKLCYAVILLSLPTCRAFSRILNILLSALSSPQPTLRSRSLKSVIQLLENDPSILDQSGTVIAQILRCSQDTSPLVRDSALSLVAKCAVLRPSLEAKAGKCFIERSSDAAVGVRKRSVKLLRDLYLRSVSREVRAAIADAILVRLNDDEESVSDLARQTIEEIWLNPFHRLCAEETVELQHRQALEQHAFLITATAKRGPEATGVLETLIKDALRSSSKTAKNNRDVCKVVVRLLFDCIIDNDQNPSRPSQKDCLHALTIFAKADPHLFLADQMITLRPYIENLATKDDLDVFRSTLIIYCRVLPALPPMQKSFLFDVQDILFKAVTKLGKTELEEAARCLWIINGVVKNTERLVNLLVSVLRNVDSMRGKAVSEKADTGRLCRLIALAGHFGKACKLEDQMATFQNGFPGRKMTSVSGMIIDILLPFVGEMFTLQIRETALAAIGLVCQAWPQGYQEPQACAAFKAALQGQELSLQVVVLEDLRAFYVDEDVRSKTEAADTASGNTSSGKDTLGKSMVLTDVDGAATAIAHQFLPSILEIALRRDDHLALTATDILTSISRQGLMHPKEIIVALVALEGSPNSLIAKIAFDEHRDLHSKHESMLDREYLAAVDGAFVYQRDTAKQPSGVYTSGSPKLGPLYEVLKTGSVTARKRLTIGLCQRLETQATKSKADLDYTCFVAQNLGLLEYSRVDEIMHVISAIEKALNSTGNAICQQIEAALPAEPQADMATEHAGLDQPPQALVNPALDKLMPAVCVISMLHQVRHHLRSAWAVQSRGSVNAKSAAKDANKPPTRAASVTSEGFLSGLEKIVSAIHDREAAYTWCKHFVEFMSIDNETKASSEEEVDRGGRHATPSEQGTESSNRTSVPLSAQKGRKRLGTSSATPTPTKVGKKRARPAGPGRRKSSKGAVPKHDDDDDYE